MTVLYVICVLIIPQTVYKNGRFDGTVGPAHSVIGVNAYILRSMNIGKDKIVTVLIYN